MPVYKGSNEVSSGNLKKGSTNIENGYKQTDQFYVNTNAIIINFVDAISGATMDTTQFSSTGTPGASFASFTRTITTDSGTPLISDPGADLVKECFENNLSVFSLPGPSAPIASIVLANFQTENFTFRGFFPREKKKIESQLARFNGSDCPEIYFESPKRIIKTLNAILELSGDCKITFVRELTKKHEEIINTNISDLLEKISLKEKILGEITFIIEPITSQAANLSEKEIIKNNRSRSAKLRIAERI